MRGGNFASFVGGVGGTTAGAEYAPLTNNGGMSAGDIGGSDIAPKMGGRRKKSGLTAKTMKKLLKKAGMKTTGKKAALTRRLKKAGLRGAMKGGSTAGTIPAPAASAGYSGSGIGGMADFKDVSGSVPNGVVSA